MFHLVRGSVYLLVVLWASFSFLYTGLATTFTYIVLIFDISIYIYDNDDDDDDDDDDICLFHLSLHVMFLFFIYTHVSLLYSIFNFCFTLRCRDEFCLKCFRNTSCQNLPCHELSSCKIFQAFVLGLYFIVFDKWLWV